MNIQNSIATDAPVVFKCSRRENTGLFFSFVLICVWGFFIFNIIKQGGQSIGVVVFAIIFLFFLITGALIFAAGSDVVIKNDGITRCRFGKTWQTIRWDNVRLITAFPISDGQGHISKAFNVFPIVKPRYSLLPSGRMAFTDSMRESSKMIELLNHYASVYNINIEIKETLQGKFTPTSRL